MSFESFFMWQRQALKPVNVLKHVNLFFRPIIPVPGTLECQQQHSSERIQPVYLWTERLETAVRMCIIINEELEVISVISVVFVSQKGEETTYKSFSGVAGEML